MNIINKYVYFRILYDFNQIYVYFQKLNIPSKPIFEKISKMFVIYLRIMKIIVNNL